MRSIQRKVSETIRAKQQWHTPPDPEAAKLGFRGWHSRGHLPHFDVPGIAQMLNYRLEDAMPASCRHEWAALLDIKDELKRRTKLEDYLDRGLGNCELRDPRAASIVEENWQTPMAELLQNWKGYTARRINRVLGRRGKLWQEDYWDRYIRDEMHFRKVVHYIESNPVKAGLVKSPEQWPFSSARFRDEYNRLTPPIKPGAP